MLQWYSTLKSLGWTDHRPIHVRLLVQPDYKPMDCWRHVRPFGTTLPSEKVCGLFWGCHFVSRGGLLLRAPGLALASSLHPTPFYFYRDWSSFCLIHMHWHGGKRPVVFFSCAVLVLRQDLAYMMNPKRQPATDTSCTHARCRRLTTGLLGRKAPSGMDGRMRCLFH